jgi:hypothetical protein
MKSIDSVRYIYLHSLFDERKCAQRFSFELKCAFENTAKTLERPDYYGTGEGEGGFCEVDLDSLRKDIELFCSYGNCVLIGLRFGAALILDYLKSSPENISGIILIEPIKNLNEYSDYLQRKQRIKDIMTGFKEVDKKEGRYVNIEGYKTQKSFLEQLEDYGQVSFKTDSQIPVSVISNSNCGKIDTETKINLLRYEPFWERIPPQDHSQLIETIIKEVGVL